MFLRVIHRINQLPSGRSKLVISVALAFLVGIFDILGIASILPFIAVLVEPTLIQSSYLNWIYEYVMLSEDIFLVLLGGVAFALLGISQLFRIMHLFYQTKFIAMIEEQISLALLRCYVFKGYGKISKLNSAELAKNLLVETVSFCNYAALPIISGLTNLIIFSCISLFLFWLSFEAFLVACFIFGGSYSLSYLLVRKKLNFVSSEKKIANQRKSRILSELFRGYEELSVYERLEFEINHYHRAVLRATKAQVSASLIGNFPRYLMELVAFGAVILLCIGLLIFDSDSSSIISVVSGFAISGYKMLPSMQKIYSGISDFRFGQSVTAMILDELELGDERSVKQIKSPENGWNMRTGSDWSHLRVEGLVVGFPGAGGELLRVELLTLRRGEIIGFCGKTGSGKSTLLRIFAGLVGPLDGRVVATDGSGSVLEDLPSVAYVPQQTFLLDGSIAENVCFGLPRNDERINEALHLACMDKYTIAQESGIDSLVGENGAALSGGQRQRLAIARAIYRKPDIILFDESTSALDPGTEAVILKNIKTISADCLVLMVAHREAVISECDRVFEVRGKTLVDTFDVL